MNQSAHIKVLRGISTAACAVGERHLLKPMETLFYIKSIWIDRPFPDTNEARQELAEISKRCTRTIKRRISLLIELKFLRKEADGIHAISWSALRERYDLDHTKFYHIPISKHVQLEYFVKAKVIDEKKQHCEYGFKATRQRENIRAEIIKEVCGSASVEAVAEHQLNYFISEGQGYTGDADWALSMQYQKRDTKFLNGDLEINYKTGTRIFKYSSDGGFAALKRSLKAKGVIAVEQRRIALTRGTHTTTRARKTRLGFVKWNAELRKVELIRPDKITVVPYKHVDQVFLLNKQLNERMNENRAAA